MNDDEVNRKLEERMKTIFPSQQTTSRVVTALASNKPLGVKSFAHYPYYKEVYAKKLKFAVDKMISDKQDIIFRYEIFCSGPNAMSKGTLYSFVNQAMRYLVENMDSERVYANWRESITVSRNASRGGIVMSYLRGFGSTSMPDLIGESIVPVEDGSIPQWRRELDAWLESDSVQPFIKEHLAMTREEMIALKQELDEVRGIQHSVNCISIRILKVNI